MTDNLFIKPAPGSLVRDPITMKPLAEAGEAKPPTSYWLRRLADRDVTEAEPPAESDQAAEAKPAKEGTNK